MIALEAANPAYETRSSRRPGQGAGQAGRADPHLLSRSPIEQARRTPRSRPDGFGAEPRAPVDGPPVQRQRPGVPAANRSSAGTPSPSRREPPDRSGVGCRAQPVGPPPPMDTPAYRRGAADRPRRAAPLAAPVRCGPARAIECPPLPPQSRRAPPPLLRPRRRRRSPARRRGEAVAARGFDSARPSAVITPTSRPMVGDQHRPAFRVRPEQERDGTGTEAGPPRPPCQRDHQPARAREAAGRTPGALGTWPTAPGVPATRGHVEDPGRAPGCHHPKPDRPRPRARAAPRAPRRA
jgi:hypothetical protein